MRRNELIGLMSILADTPSCSIVVSIGREKVGSSQPYFNPDPFRGFVLEPLGDRLPSVFTQALNQRIKEEDGYNSSYSRYGMWPHVSRYRLALD